MNVPEIVGSLESLQFCPHDTEEPEHYFKSNKDQKVWRVKYGFTNCTYYDDGTMSIGHIIQHHALAEQETASFFFQLNPYYRDLFSPELHEEHFPMREWNIAAMIKDMDSFVQGVLCPHLMLYEEALIDEPIELPYDALLQENEDRMFLTCGCEVWRYNDFGGSNIAVKRCDTCNNQERDTQSFEETLDLLYELHVSTIFEDATTLARGFQKMEQMANIENHHEAILALLRRYGRI